VNWAMKTKGYNQRRACALAGIDPRVYRRMSTCPADTALRIRMKELASERRRFGYRRLHILLKREGWDVNWSWRGPSRQWRGESPGNAVPALPRRRINSS
jgi:putative transposase